MKFLLVGLGNPGDEYKNTRHNMGRIILEYFAEKNGFSEWEDSGKAKALYIKGKLGKHGVELLMPETFMNLSGKSVLFVKNKHKIKPENIIVIYDDLDLPLGSFRISFNKGTGGHKGLESIVKQIKTKEFIRIRIGICPITPSGKMKKPKGEKKVLDLIMKDFKKPELDIIKRISKKTNEAIVEIIQNGRVSAMNKYN